MSFSFQSERAVPKKGVVTDIEHAPLLLLLLLLVVVLLLLLLKETKNDAMAIIAEEEQTMAKNGSSSSAHMRILVYGGRSAMGLAQQDLWSLDYSTGFFELVSSSSSSHCFIIVRASLFEHYCSSIIVRALLFEHHCSSIIVPSLFHHCSIIVPSCWPIHGA